MGILLLPSLGVQTVSPTRVTSGVPLWPLAFHPRLGKDDLPPLREDWQLLTCPFLGQILPPGTRHHDPSVSS